MHTPLTVYKASAGSGKTFTLAVNYIKILLNNPHSYRNILAVTFTNKATEEMKLRILSQLYGIWKLLPSSKGYLDKVTSELDITPEHASQQAGVALSNLLHNYNYFRVETIDTFFQAVLRNLARELDLTANLHVGLNDTQVEQQAVDKLIEELSPNSKVLKWIMEYIQQNIADDKSWNVIGQIKRFGENIFKDVYKDNRKQLSALMANEEAFDSYVKTMRALAKEAESKLVGIGEGFELLLEENQLSVADFAYKEKGVCGYFVKLKNGQVEDDKLLTKRVLDAQEDPNAWVGKKEQDGDGHALTVVRNVLFDYLNNSEKLRKEQAKLLKSAKLTLRHLDQLRLLDKIETQVRELNEQSNRFLLSDTQTLLHALIHDSDSPFIFEKIGTQLEHIMIDEFQDTSTVQWANFKVLLQECMSHNQSQSLIVGDVKQSIYRWRSGDWRLLNEIEKQFAGSPHAFKIERMTTNYRSERNIVDFNNAFFEVACAIEQRELEEKSPTGAQQMQVAYQDVKQLVPTSKEPKGRVEVCLLDKEDCEQRMLANVCHTIKTLLEQGARTKDVAILVRNNNSIALIADYMMVHLPEVRLVSDEGFKLQASIAVQIIMGALRVLANPADRLLQANLATTYQTHILGNAIGDREMLKRDADVASFLPKKFWDNHQQLMAMPIFNIVEEVYQAFQLERLSEQRAYICTFYDRLNKFLVDNSADLNAVIDEWENDMKNRAIQSDELNGVRLLTIHKSKGLEFAHTIVPFCDWQLERTGGTLWCQPDEPPFNALPLVPVDLYPKQLMGSVYEKDYLHEHLQTMVDNMNLLYVAFTRAGRNLFVMGEKDKSGSRSAVIGQCLEQLTGVLPGSTLETTAEEDLEFKYGTLSIDTAEEKAKSTADNVFNTIPSPFSFDVRVYESQAQFLQSNKSSEFIGGEDEGSQQSNYIKLGSVLHAVFAQIRTLADVPNVLRQLEQDGVLYDSELTKEKLVDMLNKRFADKRVKEWFSDGWQLFNECSILSVDPVTNAVVTHRPDRVVTNGEEMRVIDFKFGKPKEEHHAQVASYMALLETMGYKRVSGYLWYVYSNKIEEVK